MAPTDEELLELMPQGFRDDLALVSRMAAHGAGPEVQPGLFRVTLNTGALDYARAVWDRARAALAQPEPEVVGPSDEEIMGLMPQQMHEDLATAARAMAEQAGADSTRVKGVMRIILNRHVVDLAHAAIAADRARFGRPAPAPDDRGVLPMIVSETGADDEPELERIICASISGGADYVNSMPRELRLERITPEGSTFARYIQVDADARPDVRPAPAPAGEMAKLVQPPGRAGLTWQGVIEGLRDVLNDESEDAIQRVWQRSRILDAISVMEANPCPAPAPAGEVAELVAWSREGGEDAAANGWDHQAQQFARVADLLERLASPACLVLDPSPETIAALKAAGPGRIELLPEDARVIEPTKHTILVPAPVPVAVSDRLPQPEDCDAEGRCWWGRPESDDWSADWTLATPEAIAEFCEFSPRVTWLPFNALPLPHGGQ